MIRRPPRSTRVRSSAASDVYKRQACGLRRAGHRRGRVPLCARRTDRGPHRRRARDTPRMSSCHGSAPAPTLDRSATTTMPDALRVLLVGGPNVGKSTLFNALTGARQHTTNAPGTTVELATGTWRTAGLSESDPATERSIVDLPGSYSLLVRSSDEQVTADAVWEFARSASEVAGQ